MRLSPCCYWEMVLILLKTVTHSYSIRTLDIVYRMLNIATTTQTKIRHTNRCIVSPSISISFNWKFMLWKYMFDACHSCTLFVAHSSFVFIYAHMYAKCVSHSRILDIVSFFWTLFMVRVCVLSGFADVQTNIYITLTKYSGTTVKTDDYWIETNDKFPFLTMFLFGETMLVPFINRCLRYIMLLHTI